MIDSETEKWLYDDRTTNLERQHSREKAELQREMDRIIEILENPMAEINRWKVKYVDKEKEIEILKNLSFESYSLLNYFIAACPKEAQQEIREASQLTQKLKVILNV